ncbi:MAG: hypothetical protein ABI824_14600 [Acidobacteriota bacterium]
MNPPRSRLTRTPPARSAPLRKFGRPPAPDPANEPRTAPRSFSGIADAAATICGPLENGVRTAYAVIDDYMKRGYDAARGNQDFSNQRGYMPDNKTYQSGWPSNPWASPQMLTEQWMTAMKTWTDLWSAFIPGGAQAWNPAAMGMGYPMGFPTSGGPAPTVSVQVSSQRPIKVTANVIPGSDLCELRVDALQSEGPVAPAIAGASVTRVPGSVNVSVAVSAEQPVGRYSGSIRKAGDGCVVGRLTVEIMAPSETCA